MHGLIHAEFREHVVDRLGRDGWSDVVADVGLDGRTWSLSSTYPDEELLALVGAVCKRTGDSVDAVLGAFGQAVAPRLMATYSAFIDARWTGADLLEHVEAVIHRTVRLQHPGATPPRLATTRVGPHEVRITYGSPRKLCGLAKGLVRGVAEQYGEGVEIHEVSCMHQGALLCDLRVRLQPAA